VDAIAVDYRKQRPPTRCAYKGIDELFARYLLKKDVEKVVREASESLAALRTRTGVWASAGC
jgi:hypothetical protein